MWFRSSLWIIGVCALGIIADISYAAVETDTLARNQTERDALFKALQASATNYSFQYVVIQLPAGSIPGKNYPIPVSHVRYDSTVLFAFDSDVIGAQADKVLADFTRAILKDKYLRSLLVVGHTDSIGSDQYNDGLSKRRALAVAAKIKAAGVNGKYLGAIPMGKAQPLSTNKTSEGRALNRRVEFFISDIPEATERAIELIPFNPCFRNDQDMKQSNCDNSVKRIPIYDPDDSKSRRSIELGRLIERPRLPAEVPTRPSLQELASP